MLPFLLFWTKLTVAFTCTSLPLNLYTSVFGCGYCFGFEKQFWRNDGFGDKNLKKTLLHFTDSWSCVKNKVPWTLRDDFESKSKKLKKNCFNCRQFDKARNWDRQIRKKHSICDYFFHLVAGKKRLRMFSTSEPCIALYSKHRPE